MPKLLTSEDIVSEFKITPRTLHRWISEGRFPTPLRVGKGRSRRRWYEADVIAFLDAKKQGAA
ncbi:helix-turn-helix transcriptional regulator [Rhizobium puerariae]|uniref:Helix-turn-helix transcriptional regulator n=1 Tax=Rhizobium puerariae TaxID=1585791 RepID=A0ABV6AS22_9HYPH